MSVYPVTRYWTDNKTFDKLHSFPLHIGIYKIREHMNPHRHEYLELSLVIEGEGQQIINGNRYPFNPGTFTFLLPYQIHEIFLSSDKPFRIYNCMFDLDFLFQSSGVKTGLNELLFTKEELLPTIQLGQADHSLFASIMQVMLLEYNHKETWRYDLIQMKLVEALIYFDRLRKQESVVSCVTGTSPTKTIWPIIHYIHSNYRDPVSLSSLSQIFGISSPYLSAEFKKHTGLNFIHFLHDIRIRHACSLLVSSNMSGIDIAIEVGFSSFKSFSRIFQELKGITVSEYRKHYRVREGSSES